VQQQSASVPLPPRYNFPSLPPCVSCKTRLTLHLTRLDPHTRFSLITRSPGGGSGLIMRSMARLAYLRRDTPYLQSTG
jgi:hypothetical protein